MNHFFRVAGIAILLGLATAPVATSQAQTPTPVFWIATMSVQKAEAFSKEFMPLVTKIFTDHGGKYISRGGKITALEGDAPSRIVIVQFPSVNVAQAVYASPEYKQARKIGDQYAKFESIFAVETLP